MLCDLNTALSLHSWIGGRSTEAGGLLQTSLLL
jgi:hypothetical protein